MRGRALCLLASYLLLGAEVYRGEKKQRSGYRQRRYRSVLSPYHKVPIPDFGDPDTNCPTSTWKQICRLVMAGLS